MLQLLHQSLGQSLYIHFQTKIQSCGRADSRSYTAEGFSLERAVELKFIAPKSFIAEGVIAKRLLTLNNHFCGVLKGGIGVSAFSVLFPVGIVIVVRLGNSLSTEPNAS